MKRPATSPDWGDRLDPTVIGAINAKKLLPIAQLDRGFIRPTYPESGNRVLFSSRQDLRLHQREVGIPTSCWI